VKVAMICARFHPYIGGAEKQALELSVALKAKGTELEVLTRREEGCPGAEEVRGVPVRRLAAFGPGSCASVAFLLSLAAYLAARPKRFDVYHAHLASSHAIAAALAARAFGAKAVVKLGGGVGVGEIARSRGTALGRLKLAALGRLRPNLVALNGDQEAELAGTGLEGLPLTLIPNGVDLSAYRPETPESRRELREKLGWTGRVFLFVGRLDSDKGQSGVLSTFLEGFKRAAVPGTIVLVGEGPRRAELEAKVTELGLRASVRFEGAKKEIAPLLQAAHVFVQPSMSEGMSNALLEALASGLPVLASRVTGIEGLIEEGKEGLLFDPHSAADIENAVKWFDSEPEKLEEMGRQARRKAEAYSIEKIAEKYLELYRA
jgi:glycosyltransferase involved in cell wall biosynthesis